MKALGDNEKSQMCVPVHMQGHKEGVSAISPVWEMEIQRKKNYVLRKSQPGFDQLPSLISFPCSKVSSIHRCFLGVVSKKDELLWAGAGWGETEGEGPSWDQSLK